jgi:predicted RNase H-like HicB family nuclease
MSMDYIAYLHKEKDSDYGVSFPDFPGCITAGRTLEEARRMAAEALAVHIQGMLEEGLAVPESSKLDSLEDDPNTKGAVTFLVAAELVDKTVRVNIVLTPRKKAQPKAEVIVDPLTGYSTISVGPDAPVLTSKEVEEMLSDFP